MEYSISNDKIIIVGKVAKEKEFVEWLSNDYNKYSFRMELKTTYADYKFRYMCKFPGLILFYSLNGDESSRDKIKIVYNPNKAVVCDDYSSDSLLQFILNYCSKYELKECDVAIDFKGIDREKCLFFPNPRSTYSYIRGHDNSMTEYSGQHHTHGFTKLYDKQKESNLDYKCVRFEMTFREYTELSDMPYFLYVDHDDVDSPILQLMISAGSVATYKYISSLSGKTKKKFRQALETEFWSSKGLFNEMLEFYKQEYKKYTDHYLIDTDNPWDPTIRKCFI